ncbi:MAG: 50S ribosomal protein L3 [Candidatus Krumholzibacteria bacterium]|jgi:large subunit ribosomal protein L3|nr:50S ribosomal protein L3 [Candidatus Krumholzibacteria bacterium]MDP6669156.1 50S ribosomal protein L3 [Candidatus Krumholzibacteria bacterium]MDP6796828.1 50S ribosomal protein L3 [Candidatus Krumholzibacteria bacterium]MDP7021298.1 50S ribosomal protein L3 [Candidatus Krumholzibacteria bacterium]
MSLNLLGKKLGMTHIFKEDGRQIPVTVVQLGPNYIIQKKTVETDGYNAVQLGFEPKRAKNTSKALQGHFHKAGFNPLRHLSESRLDESELDQFNVGDELKSDYFSEGEMIDATGTSKGRGFTGVIKRHGMHGTASLTHGSHEVMRHAGSIGQSATPSRVFKGKRMAGRHGNEQVTVQGLEVMEVRAEESLLLVKGAVPGPTGGLLHIRKSVKA